MPIRATNCCSDVIIPPPPPPSDSTCDIFQGLGRYIDNTCKLEARMAIFACLFPCSKYGHVPELESCQFCHVSAENGFTVIWEVSAYCEHLFCVHQS